MFSTRYIQFLVYTVSMKGFTIIELLIVILIISTISVLIIVNITGSKNQASEAKKLLEEGILEVEREMCILDKNDAFLCP